MRRIDVTSIEFTNAVIHGQPFKDLSGEAKALYLSLFVMDRKEYCFSKSDLIRYTNSLGHSISALNELLNRGFFVNRIDGKVRLNDEYHKYPTKGLEKYDVTVTLKDVYVNGGEDSQLFDKMKTAIDNNNKDLDWEFRQKDI